MQAPRRLGLLGGTFDPPHLGHIVAAIQVCAAAELDAVHLVVANVPWQKVGSRPISEVRHRVAMTALAAASDERLVTSTVEIERGGDSVTADTVEDYRRRWPDATLKLIVGSDAAAGMGTWRRADELAAIAELIVLDRPGREGGRPPASFTAEVVECPLVDVSSTYLRDRVALGQPIDWLVPPGVGAYIGRHALYGATS